MSDCDLITESSSWQRFLHSPLVLRAYILYAGLASILSIASISSSTLSQLIVPYLGWIGIVVYVPTLWFAVNAAIGTERRALRAVPSILQIGVVFGVIDLITHVFSPEDFGNPFLKYHWSRPIVTIAIPIAWILALRSQNVRAWSQETTRLARHTDA